MLIVLNDIALKFKFPDKYTAIRKIKELIQIVIELKKENMDLRITSNFSLKDMELAEGYYFSQLFYEPQNVFDRNYQTALKTFFTKYRRCVLDESEVEYLGVYSSQCAYAHKNNGNLLSLQTKDDFAGDFFACHYYAEGKNKPDLCEYLTIRNLAVKEHINIHRFQLPIRKYEFNPKHKINSGWGTEMDLSDEIAQNVLNKAIVAELDPKHLIAKYNGKYYSFRCHLDVYYHGYWDNTMPENLRHRLDELEKSTTS